MLLTYSLIVANCITQVPRIINCATKTNVMTSSAISKSPHLNSKVKEAYGHHDNEEDGRGNTYDYNGADDSEGRHQEHPRERERE